jgi:hypothetical protein
MEYRLFTIVRYNYRDYNNPKISTLDLYNFFLAGYFLTIFWETFYIYINIIYPKFAPILRSQKKSIFHDPGLHLVYKTRTRNLPVFFSVEKLAKQISQRNPKRWKMVLRIKNHVYCN